MSGKLITATPSATLLVEEIIDRYGSVEQFCNLLRRDLDDPTVQLPRITPAEPSNGTASRYLAWSESPERADPAAPAAAVVVRDTGPAPAQPADSDDSDDSDRREADRRRGLWRRLMSWF